MNFKRFHESRNLFDKSTVTHGYYVNDMTGIIATNPTYEQEANASDYFPISGDSVSIYSNPAGKWRWGAFYDSNKTYVSGITGYNKTITIPENARYMRLTVVDEILDTLMVNLGSTALPYEPYSSEVWHDTPHYIHNTSTDTITTLPADIYANDTTATVGLKGQAVQSTTPTPDNPVMPQGTGERTENLCNQDAIETDKPNNVVGRSSGIVRAMLQIKPNTSYVCSWTFTSQSTTGVRNALRLYSGNTYLNVNIDNGTSFSLPSEVLAEFTNASLPQIVCYFGNAGGKMENFMLVEGSSALPYEPFGVKIPISSAGQVTPVYLGEVQTTRKIQKLVLTGQESWYFTDSNRVARLEISDYMKNPTNIVICSHYKGIAPVTGYAAVGNGEVAFHKSANYLYICDGTITGNNYITFLQQQYANGTPVTIWYILSEPETGIINEPLMKIGTYADEVSNITIPVTAGGDTLSVDTTVQPSEVTVNYKGWHPVADVHERENGAWD